MNKSSDKSFYPFMLDHKPGFFLSWILYKLFKRVRFDENMTEPLKRMNREGTVVYAMKYRGHLDYLLYHYRFRRSRLPYPKIAFDLNMLTVLPLSQVLKVLRFYTNYFFKHGRLPNPSQTGFFEDAIRQGTTSLLCLVDPKGFARHFIYAEKDYIHLLLETQKTMERPIHIVPQLVIYEMTPEKEHSSLLDIFFGFKDNPGLLRKVILFFRYNRRAFVDFGEPINLKTYLQDQPPARSLEEMSPEIRQTLLESIDRQKRVILGPVMKSRQQLKETVLTDNDITGTIEQMASGDKKRLKQLRKKAGGYFDEIAADFNVVYIEFSAVVLKWLWNKIFQGIDVDSAALGVVREWSRKGPLVYIPSHKSHIDYLVLNHILYEHHMHVPRIAAGKNLAFWPLGPYFRKAGAFFIRRSFRGAKLYARVFTRYIKALLNEGHPLEFFIEGGRSRSGKLILPKIGFLSILLQAYQEGYCDDLIFVPASISYDRILEEKAYLKELSGEKKKKESFNQFLKVRHFLKRKYGKIYIRFGRPLSLKEYLSRLGDTDEAAHRQLAFHLINGINEVTVVTPLALLASAILTKHRSGFHIHELKETAGTLLKFIERYDISIAESLNHCEKAIEETIDLLINWKMLNFLEDVDGAETFYYVEEEKKNDLEYYKNSIIHWFISHAFVALSMLTGRGEIITKDDILTDYEFLRKLFRNEFIYNDERSIQDEIKIATDYFSDAALITNSHDREGYQLTRRGYDELPMWGALVKTFLESYWIVARAFIQREKKGRKKSDLLKNMNYSGQRLHKLGIIDHPEAISQLNFQNAIRIINKDILATDGESEEDKNRGMERLTRFSQRLYELSHFKT